MPRPPVPASLVSAWPDAIPGTAFSVKGRGGDVVVLLVAVGPVRPGPGVRSAAMTALERVQLAVTGLMVFLVLVMAAIAGRSLFGSWDIVVHGGVGNGLFLLAMVAAFLSFATNAPGRIVIGAMAFMLLAFVQIGLGYVGRDTIEAAVWHVPNGVLLMGIATFQLGTLLSVRQPPDPGATT